MTKFKRNGHTDPKPTNGLLTKRRRNNMPVNIKTKPKAISTGKKKSSNGNVKKLKGGNGNGHNGNGNRKLTANEKIFADEWLIDRNATRAYMVAYKNITKRTVAGVSGHLKLKKDNIATYVSKALAKISATARIDSEWVLKRYEMLADYCIADFFNDDGTMKKFSEIPREALYAVGGFKQSKRTISKKDEDIITDRIKEFKLPSKRMVLDSIGKHLGMFQKDDDNNNRGGISIDKAVINIKLVD